MSPSEGTLRRRWYPANEFLNSPGRRAVGVSVRGQRVRPSRIHPASERTNRRGWRAKFWFHALCNCFIAVADRGLMLPTSLTKRLVNHAPSEDITEGYAADWTMGSSATPPSASQTGSTN